jgi:hypothetical protein
MTTLPCAAAVDVFDAAADGHWPSIRAAGLICGSCSVRTQCAEAAAQLRASGQAVIGVWSGVYHPERGRSSAVPAIDEQQAISAYTRYRAGARDSQTAAEVRDYWVLRRMWRRQRELTA